MLIIEELKIEMTDDNLTVEDVDMKQYRVLTILSFLSVAIFVAGIAFVPQAIAQRGMGMHHGMWGGSYEPGESWSYCPYCGSRLRDRDRDERSKSHGPQYNQWPGKGYGIGPGMMGHDYSRRYDAPAYRNYWRRDKPLTEQKAEELVKDMLKDSRNPNLTTGGIEEKENFFIVEIRTKEGNSLVDRIEVDRESGMMQSEYR